MYFPFSDNIHVANKYYVKHMVQPCGSLADDNIIKTCNEYGISMFTTNGNGIFALVCFVYNRNNKI